MGAGPAPLPPDSVHVVCRMPAGAGGIRRSVGLVILLALTDNLFSKPYLDAAIFEWCGKNMMFD
ncbi:hypothetical protein AA650_13950 [Anabaena sp. WA102]|jgi:hypothetical protein|nr:hypothetical protein AA650_13950 [Anabaena sp. WA102]